ncbi:hypothetical protein JTT01_10165 [Clostridium botulinum]|nr:hypothetical protein [Clostridium botulinum]MCS4521928.1 hypothetical protein [Clostridium botulinum]
MDEIKKLLTELFLYNKEDGIVKLIPKQKILMLRRYECKHKLGIDNT